MEEILINILALAKHESGCYSGENGIALLELDIETTLTTCKKYQNKIESLEYMIDTMGDKLSELENEAMLCVTQEIYTVDGDVCEAYEKDAEAMDDLVKNVRTNMRVLFQGDR